MKTEVLERPDTLRRTKLWVVGLAAVCVLVLSVVRTPGGDINYYNSDATWHILMTMQAYEETPAAIHHYAPLINMGEEADKWISWGATVPDEQGNYYYTSFSAAGFALPYFICKLLGLPLAEGSLYAINCVLFFLTAALMGAFAVELFGKTRWPLLAGAVAVAVYVCPPEVLHGTGVVYWPHSVMQLTLLLQLWAYYRWTQRDSKGAWGLFLALCLFNPYLEWTGFVANGGYALAEFFRHRKGWLRGFGSAVAIGVLTVLSFLIFSLHFLSVVDLPSYLEALKGRFLARGTTSSYPFSRLFTGYVDSFLWLWALLAILFVLVVVCWRGFSWRKHSLLMGHKWLLFAAFFPVLENLLMKGHAILYTFDRMKLVFPLALILCDLCLLLAEKLPKRTGAALACALVLAAALGNVTAYVGNEAYVWKADYREGNRQLGQYVVPYEEDSVMGCTAYGGRSIYLDFQRGVHEYVDLDTMIAMAEERGKRYAILLQLGEDALTSWGMPTYDSVQIYDTLTGTLQTLRVEDGTVTVS